MSFRTNPYWGFIAIIALLFVAEAVTLTVFTDNSSFEMYVNVGIAILFILVAYIILVPFLFWEWTKRNWWQLAILILVLWGIKFFLFR